MKALSVKQPWACLIMENMKDIEVWTWAPPASIIGHRIFIHTGKQRSIVPSSVWEQIRELPQPAGYLIGTVTLLSYKTYRSEMEFMRDVHRHKNFPDGFVLPNTYGWILSNPVKLIDPILFRGNLKLFEVPDDAL